MEDHNSKPGLWQSAVLALANGQLPDFTGYSEEVVFAAFDEVFWSYRMDSGQIAAALSADVSETSCGRARLELADDGLFSATIKGPAVYLRLTVDSRSRLLTFGPYGTPFSWDQGR